MSGRVFAERKTVHIPDVFADPEYTFSEAQRIVGFKAMLGVPLMREGTPIGILVLQRTTARPFDDKHIELVETFADQAVIAIENVRLFDEVQARTDDLTESLEYQTATGEILGVISKSPTQVQPVFDIIAANALRLCNATWSIVLLFDGETIELAAMNNVSDQQGVDALLASYPRKPSRTGITDRAITSGSPVYVPDISEVVGYEHQALADSSGYRSGLAVPMLRDGKTVGAITVAGAAVNAFTDRQKALLRTFADQAVIAIENVRLFDEVQKRTEDLSESLQQQTATADVLKVISRSTFDLQKVFETLVESATRLCRAEKANIWRLQGDNIQYIAACGFEPDFMDYMHSLGLKLNRGMVSGRAALEGRIVHIHDILTDAEFSLLDTPKLAGFRTALGVPLMREGHPIGGIFLTRPTVDPFTPQEINLVATFADQAVIAIENVRLFDEIQDKSRQLAEASQHKSQFLANMSHELRTPLNAILGYTELISDGVYGAPPEKMSAVLKRVESNGRHLLGLINAVLDLSKIEAGQLALDLADYSMGDVTHTVYSAVEALAIDKKLAFKAEVAPDLPRGRGDERRLTQVLLNLAGNAIKFTDAGEVVIKAAASDGSFNLSVCDTGPGISDADQAKLFQEFQQADNSITRKKEGTGLGLAISKRIVEMHGGRIWVESHVGRGSTFFVTLPVQVEQQAKPPSG